MERPKILSLQQTQDTEFIREVEAKSGQQISKCYQCGNCSASCNYTYVFDYPVNQIMRLIQLGQKETVLRSQAIWQCACCQACTTRCPNDIEVARVMAALRDMSMEQGMVSKKHIRMFYDDFLKSVRRFGRVFEPGLLLQYNFKAFKLFNDAELGPGMLKRGKLPFIPYRSKDVEHVSGIFERFEAWKNEQKRPE